jgi:hypothetical protein
MRRTAASRDVKSSALFSRSVRMWTHGIAPARRSFTMWAISLSVNPSRRAWDTNINTSSTSDGYMR